MGIGGVPVFGFNSAAGLELDARAHVGWTTDGRGIIDPRYGAWVWFMAYSGLRWGEAAALRRGRVNGRWVRVVESLSEVSGAHFKETKTYGSPTVILPTYVTWPTC
jgi:hypothetical protein